MNRIDRLSAILVQLQSHSLVKAQQISERFEISIRTVYRDIRALEESGIPIIGNPGIGYSLIEGFKLPPLMFTQSEALAFIIAEKLVHELTDSDNNKYYQSGIEKIRAVMRYADKDALERVESNISTLNHKSNSYKPDILQLIIQSIYQQKVLNITYFTDSTREITEREIEPVGIFFSRTNWYMIAYCLTKKAYRTFRISRIQKATQLDRAYSRQHAHLNNFLEKIHNNNDLYEIVIRIEKENTQIIGDDRYYYGLTSEKENEYSIEYTFLTFSLDKFAHWYISYADIGTIVKPDALKDKIRNILDKISL